jgi:hypothetical protein
MKIGTKSLLFGAHQFLMHPCFVAVAWHKLYGFPWDPRLWVAFVVHDWGYWGLSDMDGDDGQRHPELGGRIMRTLFGDRWGDFTRLHSRYYAQLEDRVPSRLCYADKLATAIVPPWLYLPMVRATGELEEYMHLARRHNFYSGGSSKEWFRLLSAHWKELAYAHAGAYNEPNLETATHGQPPHRRA